MSQILRAATPQDQPEPCAICNGDAGACECPELLVEAVGVCQSLAALYPHLRTRAPVTATETIIQDALRIVDGLHSHEIGGEPR